MSNKKEIRSETFFLFSLIKDIILLPFILILVLIRKKEPKELLTVFSNLHTFFTEAKVTIILIISNIIMFFLMRSLLGFGVISEQLFTSIFVWFPENLLKLKIISMFGSMFMHASVGHLFSNMIALFIFGRVVEKELGSMKMFFVYLGSGVISFIVSSIIYIFVLESNVGAVGASGAIMGLISVAILFKPFYLSFNLLIPLPIMILGWLALAADFTGILSGAKDGVGHFAHLGGFFAISLLFFFLDKKDREQLKKGFLINIASFIIILVLYLFVFKGKIPFSF